MFHNPATRHRAEVTGRFLEGGLAATVAVVSLITLATLIYAWFLA